MIVNNLLCYIYSQCEANDEGDVQGIDVEDVVQIIPRNGEKNAAVWKPEESTI